MTITVKTARNTFVKSMGDGAKAAQALKVMIDDMLDNELDGRVIAAALNDITTNQVQDLAGYRATKAILGLIFTGLKFKLDDQENIKIGTKNAVFNPEVYNRFADAVADGVSIRGTLVDRVKGEKDKVEFDLVKYASQLVKRADKEGITKAALIAAIQAA